MLKIKEKIKNWLFKEEIKKLNSLSYLIDGVLHDSQKFKIQELLLTF